jgi:very-short-patch-repair endonuclease
MRGLSRTQLAERALAALATRQHGVVARSQLVALGIGEDAIEHRLRLGRLQRLHRGVYAVGHGVLSRHGRWLAAVLSCGEGAVLSHWSAAELWGIRAGSRETIDVTLPRRSRNSSPIRRHCCVLPPDETTVEDGIPVTTVPRTIFDLAAASPVDVVENALREAEFLNLYDALSLGDLVARYPRSRGVESVRRALRRLEEEPAGRRRSRLEERFIPFLRHHCLPLPRLNAWIEAGGNRYQVDCLWSPSQIIELDGWQGHGTRSAFRDDRARDRRLRVAGYAVTRLAWSQLDDEPEEIAADLRSLLAVRPPGLPRPPEPGRS